MIDNNQKTSSLVLSQLPEYVRDNPEYANFNLFLKAYYEWMETNGKVTERSKNLLNYKDVDATTEEFIDYFNNEFLPFFPRESLVSQEQAVKVARQLYQSKGTPASYEFLFRVLYNTDVEIFNTKDSVFKASGGTWYIAKSLKLLSNNPYFLQTKNYRVFGEVSKSIATIEAAVLVGTKTEIFISNIERLFNSGETIRIVDSNNQDVLFGGQPLRAKIVGQISQIKVNPTSRGLTYQPGDPVVVYGGLNANVANPVGAIARVGEITKGSIQRINVVNGGYGYSLKPNTVIIIEDSARSGARANVGSISPYLPPAFNIVNGGAGYKINDSIVYDESTFAYVSKVDANGTITNIKYSTTVNAQAIVGITAQVFSSNVQASGAIIKTATAVGNARANVAFIPMDVIGFKKEIKLSNVNFFFANTATTTKDTTLANAFTFGSITTYPISSVVVENGGGGITKIPEISALSTYMTEDSFDEFAINSSLESLGILGPIQINNGGAGYRANDRITFTGGRGQGPYANVVSVDASGAITSVDYFIDPQYRKYPKWPLGGMGYNNEYLPSVSVVSANAQASDASLFVPGILGTGAVFSPVVDRAGSVTTITIDNYGEDYEFKPNVSIRIQDIVVSNVAIENLPQKDDIIYQGPTINLASYSARVNSVSLLTPDANSQLSLYNLRVYNYNSQPQPDLPLTIDGKYISLKMANAAFPQFVQTYDYFDSVGNQTVYSRTYDKTGVITFGDGTAKANATFLNGLVIGDGQYLTTQGQPSSYDVLQSTKYNNFTYQITLEKEIAKYREVLLNLLHPTGTNVIGRYALKSNNKVYHHAQESLYRGEMLSYYLGEHVSNTLSIITSFTNKSNNIIKFNNKLGANLEGFIFPNESVIEIKNDRGVNIKSLVIGVNDAANTITIASNVWLTFGNVAVVGGTSGSNTLNITSLTGQFDYENGGVYSNTSYPLKDIVYSGDSIQMNANVYTVKTVNYTQNKIVLTTNLSVNENTLLSVKRNFIANSTPISNQIKIFGPIGIQYIPAITTENGITLTAEDDRTILLG
jgi:hypothetical protein